ncbi:protein-L-histidine N-pros-methyltransferase-like [Argiope bruennichi]|uniref:protein-L-histidine N-pros-methyltransferase-like n=1 Tax=Argiope bruennichi TaxID=94029 RepID=UPI002493F589|nr:protein-L-histidine N-pros-methyltransferase-like [Argiope bruennichi]XP_055953711.1 protein-L-histidine N-pros-methyltransferase-like [Argiope bruennichi]XP_055953712.1 protein-L-histidine N-pros-methyltransferase-like [Argiope bruennichi]
MTTRPYLRSSLARSLYEKMVRDDNLRHLDKSKWYDVDLDLVDCEIKDVFFASRVDDETEDFLENCFEKSDWLMTQIFHALVRSLMCWFMSRTSINGLLGRGSMFVFSNAQFENIVSPFSNLREDWKTCGNLLDLGAGDGKVTEVMARHFRHTYATEVSPVMRKTLAAKNYTLLDVDKWANPDEGPRYFDLISCLNLLDRCDRPITLLQQIRSKLNPDTGILILAVVLPLSQYVESGSKYNQPTEKIAVKGRKFEEQAAYLATHLFQENGFQVLRWTRLPYLCEGDLDQAFYWLNDALFVMKVADPCDS